MYEKNTLQILKLGAIKYMCVCLIFQCQKRDQKVKKKWICKLRETQKIVSMVLERNNLKHFNIPAKLEPPVNVSNNKP